MAKKHNYLMKSAVWSDHLPVVCVQISAIFHFCLSKNYFFLNKTMVYKSMDKKSEIIKNIRVFIGRISKSKASRLDKSMMTRELECSSALHQSLFMVQHCDRVTG
jgi:hypothetical protein